MNEKEQAEWDEAYRRAESRGIRRALMNCADLVLGLAIGGQGIAFLAAGKLDSASLYCGVAYLILSIRREP